MSASQLSPELRALLRRHPLPKRTEGDRILKGDLAYGSGRYADAAESGGGADLWGVFLAIEAELGNDIAESVLRLVPSGRLGLARWCFASGRVDVGLEAFRSLVGAKDAGVEDEDLMEYLTQVEATRGEDAFIAAADELLERSSTSTFGRTSSQRVLHACVRALSARGDLHGAQTRLAKYGDASSTMAGALRVEDLNLPTLDEPTPRDAPATTRQSPESAPQPSRTAPVAPPIPRVPAAPAPTPKANHPVIGQLVGGSFQINGFVCEGRIAQLFSALREKSPRHVALKVMLPGFAEDAEAARQFQAAATRAKKLDHSSIVAVLAAGADRGWQYVATEMVFGENLASYVQTRGPLALPDALRIALEITKTLEHAYAQGVVHGGLRPSNVFITRDVEAPEVEHVRVADFGMAEVVASTRPLDGFTSPEQARDAPAGPASDVYGVGALLHFMLTGAAPFADLSGDALRQAILRERLPRDADVPALGTDIVSLFARVLTKEAGKRMASASELAAALTALGRHAAAQAAKPVGSGTVPTADEVAAAEELTVSTQRTGKHSALAADHPLVGQLLDGRFRVVSFMRAGGMAQLYHGTQSVEPRQVAIKVMHPVFASEPEIVKRFAREARLAAKLDHPNIVRLIHVGDNPAPLPTSGRTLLYIAMEILAGEDLSVRMKQRGRLAEAQAAEIAVEVTSALAYAHALGVVHRDIKPANVMMCTGELRDSVKLLDFGIAKVLDKPTQTHTGAGLTMNRSVITTVGDLVGTPRYMSPEQGRAEPVDHKADLYSLGVVLYELVTGSVPFDGETALQIIARHVQDEPEPPSKLIADIHPDLDRLILELLRKDPRARPSSAGEVRQRLTALLPQLSVSPATSTQRWMHRPASSKPRRMTPPLGMPPVAVDIREADARAQTAPPKTALATPLPQQPVRTVPMRAQPRTMAEAGAQRPVMVAVQAPLAPLPTPLPMSSPSSVLSPGATQPVDITQVPKPPLPQTLAAGQAPPAQVSSGQRSGPASTARMMRDHVLADAQRFMIQPVAPEPPRGPTDSGPEGQSPQLVQQVARLYRLVQLLIVLIVLLAAAMVVIVVLK